MFFFQRLKPKSNQNKKSIPHIPTDIIVVIDLVVAFWVIGTWLVATLQNANIVVSGMQLIIA